MQHVWSTYYRDSYGVHSRNNSANNNRNNNNAGAGAGDHRMAPLGVHGQAFMDDMMNSSNSRNFSYPQRRPRPNSAESDKPILESATPMAYEQRLGPPNPPFSSSSSSNNNHNNNNNINNSPTLHQIPSVPSLRTPADSIKNPGDNVSLTVNYLPTKFSRPHSPGIYHRKNRKDAGDADAGEDELDGVPKRGGGREAFRAGEARMAGPGDEEYEDDLVAVRYGGKKQRMRWNRFKWILFGTNTFLTIYSLIGLIFCLLTWFNVWKNADIIRVGNRPELILSTVAASIAVFTSLIGWSGILLNNRAFLSIYNLLLWLSFAILVVPGYVTYRRQAFDLEGKVNFQWSRTLGTLGRLRIQNELQCCGYFSPFTEATISQTCYARTVLRGCKLPYLKFEQKALERWFVIVFALVPFQLGIMVAGLLCSNHVTYRFGKGMMPKAYRLSLNSMAVIMDQYANQLAEQYGTEVANTALAQSKSRLNLNSSTPTPTVTPGTTVGSHGFGFGSGGFGGGGGPGSSPSSSSNNSHSNHNHRDHVGVAMDMHVLPSMPYGTTTSSNHHHPPPLPPPSQLLNYQQQQHHHRDPPPPPLPSSYMHAAAAQPAAPLAAPAPSAAPLADYYMTSTSTPTTATYTSAHQGGLVSAVAISATGAMTRNRSNTIGAGDGPWTPGGTPEREVSRGRGGGGGGRERSRERGGEWERARSREREQQQQQYQQSQYQQQQQQQQYQQQYEQQQYQQQGAPQRQRSRSKSFDRERERERPAKLERSRSRERAAAADAYARAVDFPYPPPPPPVPVPDVRGAGAGAGAGAGRDESYFGRRI